MSAETALREDLGRFLRRVGGLTVEFRDGKAFLPVRDDWVGDLEAGYRAALSARPDSPTLDVAWAECEAAMPDGWQLREVHDSATATPGVLDWMAVAEPTPAYRHERGYFGARRTTWLGKGARGATPAEALQALAAALAADTPPSDAPEQGA